MKSVIILQYIAFLFAIFFMPKPEVLSDINQDIKAVFDTTPKLWRHYIRKFLHKYLNYYMEQNRYSTLRIYFDQMFKHSSVFNKNKYKYVISARHGCAQQRGFYNCTYFLYEVFL